MKEPGCAIPQLGIVLPPRIAGQMQSVPCSCGTGEQAGAAVTIVSFALRSGVIFVYVCTLHELAKQNRGVATGRKGERKTDSHGLGLCVQVLNIKEIMAACTLQELAEA